MRFEISTAPTSEPITVADVETHSQLGTVPADQVAVVSRLITAARQLCESRNKRQYCTATWKAYLDEWPDVIEIRDKLPVTGITSIQYVDSDGDTQTWGTTNYETDFASQDRPARIMLAEGASYPTLDTQIYSGITITFTAGYGGASAVPDVAKHAMLILVDHWYNQREYAAPASLTEVPMGFKALLDANNWGWYG